MKLRDAINNNQALVSIGAVVLLVLALGFIFYSNTGSSTTEFQSYYLDVNTRELIVDGAGKLAPFDTPSGQNAGVMAYVFTCETSCKDKSKHFIAYLERYRPKAKQMMEEVQAGKRPEEDRDLADQGREVARYEEDKTKELKWVLASSPAAGAILESPMERCAGAQPKYCTPSSK